METFIHVKKSSSVASEDSGGHAAETDIIALAHLHAALDSVVDSEEFVDAIHRRAPHRPALARLADYLRQAREQLRELLATADKRRHS
jgi:hypothetical protein